jgi:hypothetical protein
MGGIVPTPGEVVDAIRRLYSVTAPPGCPPTAEARSTDAPAVGAAR